MTHKSNATNITLDDSTKAIFDAIENVENLRDTKVSFGTTAKPPDSKLPAPKRKQKLRATNAETIIPIIDNIADNGGPYKYTNGKPADGNTFKATKEAAFPTKPPAEPSDTLINLSTEKPEFTLADFHRLHHFDHICSGVVYYARNGYNRHGIGTPRRFVAVMGGGGESWAIYVGGILPSLEWIETDGEKVCLEAHIQQLIDCEETLLYYRF